MREAFPGYYRPTEEEFRELWQTAVFALDANVLLHVYGYSVPTRKTLLQLIEQLGERLWIPHQFADEYQRNRVKAILEQVESYRSTKKQFDALLTHQLRPQHKHPFISKKSMAAMDSICNELEKGLRDHERLLSVDPYFARLTELFAGRVGRQPTSQELNGIYREARSSIAQVWRSPWNLIRLTPAALMIRA